MATYRNATAGARAVHLTNGTYKLVEPGALITVEDSKVRRMAPGFVRAKKGDLPEVPAELAEKVEGGEKLSDLSKAELVKRRPEGMTEAAAKKLSRDKLIAAIEG